MTKTEKLHFAVARECNSATTDPNSATPNTTPVQQGSLKGMANKVLERNNQCNSDATTAQSECNKLPLKDTEKLHTISKPVRWDPEMAAEGYVWCYDCQYWDQQACSHPDNPFRQQCVLVPRYCRWYVAE